MRPTVVRITAPLTVALLLAIAAVPVLAAPSPASPPSASPPATVGDDVPTWIVTLHDDHPAARNAAALVRQHDGTLRNVYTSALNGFSFRGTEQAARNLARNPRVRRVEADRPVQATDPGVPWGVARIAAPQAHDAGHDGGAVRIAILDTGIDASHPALTVATQHGRNCVDPGSASTNDVNSHGTHVAGTATARLSDGAFTGVATRAELVPVKVLDDLGDGTWASVICGIDHVTALTREHGVPIAVANMSLSGSGSAGSDCDASALRRAVCTSVAAGIVHTVAAGNDGGDAATRVPAAFPEAITVSALDDARCSRVTGGGPPRTECTEGLASFSNRGPAVDVIAPGVRITSTLPGGRYGDKGGTSMAAPHAAGVVALMRAVNDQLDPAQIRDLLQATGECPNGQENAASAGACQGQGQWFGDPDGIAEPLLAAARAAAAASTSEPPADDPDPVYVQPSADFGYTCDGLTCGFTNLSTVDEDLTATYTWTFGDGATATSTDPTHTYTTADTYTVSLTVTDSQGRSDTTTANVEVVDPDGGDPPDDGGGGQIELSASGYKVRGLHHADLAWSGTTGGAQVSIRRDGQEVGTGSSDAEGGGNTTDAIGGRGGASYDYQVCEVDDPDRCSPVVTVTF